MTNIVRPRIAPSSMPLQLAVGLAGSAQLLVGPASSFVGVQIESELLDTRDVVRIRAMQIRAGNFLLVQLDQHSLPSSLIEQVVIFPF